MDNQSARDRADALLGAWNRRDYGEVASHLNPGVVLVDHSRHRTSTGPGGYVDRFRRLLDAFEALAVVSSESMQHQNYIAVLETFSGLFERLPNDQQEAVEDRILRILSALGDHVLTTELEEALTALAAKLRESERWATADAVQTAKEKLAQSVGKLNSRATRVK